MDAGAMTPEAWDGSFEAAESEQRRRWAEETTPEQRLAWLEEAVRLAHAAGALPDRERT